MAIEAHLAPIGSPVGIVGMTVEDAVAPWLSLGVGGGAGLSGAQGALFGRARPWRNDHLALAVEGGVSTGKYHPLCPAGIDTAECMRGIDPFYVAWANVDVGLDVRFPSGVVFRAYLGASTPFYRGGACRNVDCSASVATLPFGGVSVGYAF